MLQHILYLFSFLCCVTRCYTKKERSIDVILFVIPTIIICNYRPTGVRRSFIYYNEDLVLCVFSCSIYLNIKSRCVELNNTFLYCTCIPYNHSGHVNRMAIFIIPQGYIYTLQCLPYKYWVYRPKAQRIIVVELTMGFIIKVYLPQYV